MVWAQLMPIYLTVACCVALICRGTYVKRDTGESHNDRNDHAIRVAITWYKSHFAENGLDGILLTSDKAHTNKAINQLITTYTATSLMFSLGLLYTVCRLQGLGLMLAPELKEQTRYVYNMKYLHNRTTQIDETVRKHGFNLITIP